MQLFVLLFCFIFFVLEGLQTSWALHRLFSIIIIICSCSVVFWWTVLGEMGPQGPHLT